MPTQDPRQWICFAAIIIIFLIPNIEGIRCYCTDSHCTPYGVCESSVCLVGLLKSNNAVIRTCGDEPIGCQRELGRWADLCACDQPFCNTFSYLRSNTRRERGNGGEFGVAPPLSHGDIQDDAPLIFQRVDTPLGEFSSGYDRPPGISYINKINLSCNNNFLAHTFPTQSSTNTLVFVLVPFSVGCVIVFIVWINYYRNLC